MEKKMKKSNKVVAIAVASMTAFSTIMGNISLVAQAADARISDGWYYIKNVNADKYLQVEGNASRAGANVEIRSGSGSDGQKWYVTNTSDGYITLTTALGDFMTDIEYGRDEDGANIGIYNGYSGDAQKFKLQTSKTTGAYIIATKVSDLRKAFDANRNGKTDGTNIIQWTINGNANQQWVFEPVNGIVDNGNQGGYTPVEESKAPTQPTNSQSENTQPTTIQPTTTQPTQTSNPQPSTPSQGTGVSYEYTISGDWNSGFQGQLVITNNSNKTYNGWNLEFSLGATINSLWGGQLVSQSGNKVVVKNCSWDNSFAPGAKIQIGFVASGSSSDKPSNVTFDKQVISAGGSSSNQGGNQGGSNPVEESKAPVQESKAPVQESKAPIQESKAPVVQPTGQYVTTGFPTLNMDVPDLDIIEKDGAYYMTSTTMNMCPGVPVMKSTDLVHWQIVNYVYDTFENDAVTNLDYGKHMYAHGSWAASLKYDEASKLYYCAFNSNDHGFFIYTTNDIEHGKWTKHSIKAGFHDPALFFENGKMYVISAAGGNCNIQQLALQGDRVVTVGSSQRLFSANGWSLWEGAHAYKINGYYYVFVIGSPNGRWMRTQICYRSRSLAPGYWEEKVLFQNGLGGNGAGLAQGGVVQAPNGKWFGFAFQDAGAVGRVPSVVPVNWENGWPMFKASGNSAQLGIYDSGEKNYIVDNDDFSGNTLKLVWQWNHNPQNNYWSLTKNPGYLRLTTDRTVDNIFYAHNSLTQRTYGNRCNSEVKLYTDGMKAGDYAGICAMSSGYGMVGVMCNQNGERYVYQGNGKFLQGFGNPATSYQKISNGTPVYLKISYNFSGWNPTADFYYSFDGRNFTKIGNSCSLGFDTSTTFMGTRTWLFNYATRQAGGYVDFDYYKIYD